MFVSGEDVQARGEEPSGSFYGHVLQMVTPPDYYDVETIVDRRQRNGKT